jgi:preprotein translocase subunit SecA
MRLDLIHKALSALHLFERDVHYLLLDEKIQIIDEYTGRLMDDRFWNDGLHQMVEIKEGLPISGMRQSLARITYQRFFVRYQRLSGMSGTLAECRRELKEVYGLNMTRVPTHKRSQRCYAAPRVYATCAVKWQQVAALAEELASGGRAVLIGTRTVAASQRASAALAAAGVRHVVLNAAQDAQEAEIIAQAGQPRNVCVATNMAGRGTDIHLAPEVVACGGLAVILTERHESARIDRQLAGRCGRQGDPGSIHILLSCEDMLLDVFKTARSGRMLVRLCGSSRRLALFLFRLAQWRSERLHHRVRKELLKFEDKLLQALAFAGMPE